MELSIKKHIGTVRNTLLPRSALYNWYFIKGEQFENMFNPRVRHPKYIRVEQIRGRTYVEYMLLLTY